MCRISTRGVKNHTHVVHDSTDMQHIAKQFFTPSYSRIVTLLDVQVQSVF